MATSPQKRKASVAILDELTISRSGRIRKPNQKYIDDTSEMAAKRRSMPNVEAAKPKKCTKLTQPESDTSPTFAQPEPIEMKKPEKPKSKAASINSRRRTVCVGSIFDDSGNGCIVCDRSDVKKGRFVNCIDCIKRGHFTCLRTEKLFKTADQEANWQCPSCKICEYCNKSKPSEQLYKCVICLNSYHLQCSSKIAPLPKSVVKKKFTCGFCLKGASVHSKPVEPPKPVLSNRKSVGFPGFGHMETMKADQKSMDNTKIKKVVSFPVDRDPTSSKSSSSECLSESTTKIDFNVKVEKKSPTPDQESPPIHGSFVISPVQNLNADTSSNQSISVRTDLVQPTVSQQSTDTHKPENGYDEMHIEYDTKTLITPHESIPDVRTWDIDEVYTYFLGKATPEFAQILKDHQIDGDALLLIKREDVLDRFNLKLGAALRLYAQIVSLQYKNNNPILAWNEY